MDSSNCLVTGAGSGFGLATTRELLERGHSVVAVVRASKKLDDLPEQYPGRVVVAAADVTDAEQVRGAIRRGVDALGSLRVVVSCAGQGTLGAAEEQTDQLVARQIAVNLTGSITVARAAIPYLRRAGGGRLIQLSSSGGQVADPGMSVYNATKFGIEGFYESLAIELAPFGIGVTLIAPGGSGTSFLSNMTRAAPYEVYEDGVLGQVRAALAGPPAELASILRVDPTRVAAAITDSLDVEPAPRRLVLGHAAYDAVETALYGRLEHLHVQRELAYRADYPPDSLVT